MDDVETDRTTLVIDHQPTVVGRRVFANECGLDSELTAAVLFPISADVGGKEYDEEQEENS